MFATLTHFCSNRAQKALYPEEVRVGVGTYKKIKENRLK